MNGFSKSHCEFRKTGQKASVITVKGPSKGIHVTVSIIMLDKTQMSLDRTQGTVHGFEQKRSTVTVHIQGLKKKIQVTGSHRYVLQAVSAFTEPQCIDLKCHDFSKKEVSAVSVHMLEDNMVQNVTGRHRWVLHTISTVTQPPCNNGKPASVQVEVINCYCAHTRIGQEFNSHWETPMSSPNNLSGHSTSMGSLEEPWL
ncbi:hypothetical protein BaRGS_00030321 [Batillaria attramentaria]|uniref:Uncharacterized protein n=1 Tax=Batillaria attramentaria TaxID=370345 RepID=A0ABD0JTQ5_9CAEN